MLLFRSIQADFQKMKRTSFMWLHLFIPVICSIILILYLNGREQNQYQLYRTFTEVIAISLPFLIGILCGMTASLEERAGKFQVLLGSTFPKITAFISKVLMLIILNIFSISLAMIIYIIGLTFVLEVPNLSYSIFITGGAWLVASCIVLYLLYFFISCKFGMGASVLLGGAGLLMTALMNTGLGDAIWKYNPWAWGIRLSGLNGIIHFKEFSEKLRPLLIHEMTNGTYLATIGIIMIFIACLIWFHKWEGNRTFE